MADHQDKRAAAKEALMERFAKGRKKKGRKSKRSGRKGTDRY